MTRVLPTGTTGLVHGGASLGRATGQAPAHFRLSYAVPDRKIKQGCDVLCRMAKNHMPTATRSP